MAVEMLTYADLAARLRITPEAARALTKRHHLHRSRSNDGKAVVSIDLAEIEHKPRPERSPPDHRAVVCALKARIEALQSEFDKLEATAAGRRADFEIERSRVDSLMVELLKATMDAMAAKESAARFEGELAALRARPWWRMYVSFDRLLAQVTRRSQALHQRFWALCYTPTP